MEAAGRLATALGDAVGARAAHTIALEAYAEIGTEHDRCAVHLDLAAGAFEEGNLEAAAFELMIGLPALVEAGVDRFVADGLDVAAAVLAGAGHDQIAVRTAGAVNAFRERNGVVASSAARVRFARWSADAKSRIGAEWPAYWGDGARLTLAAAAISAIDEGLHVVNHEA